MKTCVKALFLTVLLMLFFSLPVAAWDEDTMRSQWEASGASALYEALPTDTQRLLTNIGVDELTWDALITMEPQTVLSALGDVLVSQSRVPWTAAGLTLSGILVLGLYTVMCPPSSSGQAVFRTLGILAVIAPLLLPLWQTIERVQAAADGASVFSLSFAPVYAGILAASGRAATAMSYQTAMLVAAEAIGVLIGNTIVPMLCMVLALGTVGALGEEHRIGDVAAMLNKTASWLLGIALTVFVALLSFQGVLSATADSVGGRVLRFSVAGFVPVVGGALSEALYTVRGCLSVLRGTVGGFGVMATALTVLPTLVECVSWSVLLFVARTAASMFGFGDLATVLTTVQGVIKTLIGVLCSCAMLMIISVTIVTLTGGGNI